MLNVMIPAWVDGVLRPVEKLAAHQRGLKHKAVSVFITHGDKVLLQQRALGKYHTPSLWANTCCTHPAWQEKAKTCAIRRLEEELGITGLDPQFRHQLEYRVDVGNGLTEHEVVDVFLVQTEGKFSLDPNPDEVMATRWIPYSDLLTEVDRRPDLFTPWLKIYLHEHSEVIFATDLEQGNLS